MSSESEQERSTSGEIQAGGEELDGEMDVTPEESESGLSEKLSEVSVPRNLSICFLSVGAKLCSVYHLAELHAS